MKKLAIFDLDGTLLNTITDLGTAANYALEKNGFPPHKITLYPFFIGNGIKRLLRQILPEDHQNDKTVEILCKDFIEYYNLHSAENTIPYKNIPELLAKLRENNIDVAIASNKYQEATEKLVKHYFPGIDFIAVEGQKEGYPVKPDPSIIFEILGKTGTKKEDTIFIGDSGVDMEAARRACIDSIGVTWGFRPKNELILTQATYVIDNPEDILRIATSSSNSLLEI